MKSTSGPNENVRIRWWGVKWWNEMNVVTRPPDVAGTFWNTWTGAWWKRRTKAARAENFPLELRHLNRWTWHVDHFGCDLFVDRRKLWMLWVLVTSPMSSTRRAVNVGRPINGRHSQLLHCPDELWWSVVQTFKLRGGGSIPPSRRLICIPNFNFKVLLNKNL